IQFREPIRRSCGQTNANEWGTRLSGARRLRSHLEHSAVSVRSTAAGHAVKISAVQNQAGVGLPSSRLVQIRKNLSFVAVHQFVNNPITTLDVIERTAVDVPVGIEHNPRIRRAFCSQAILVGWKGVENLLGECSCLLLTNEFEDRSYVLFAACQRRTVKVAGLINRHRAICFDAIFGSASKAVDHRYTEAALAIG